MHVYGINIRLIAYSVWSAQGQIITPKRTCIKSIIHTCPETQSSAEESIYFRMSNSQLQASILSQRELMFMTISTK